jgi:hypothetical protein
VEGATVGVDGFLEEGRLDGALEEYTATMRAIIVTKKTVQL